MSRNRLAGDFFYNLLTCRCLPYDYNLGSVVIGRGFMHCLSCGHDLQFEFADLDEETNVVIRSYKCPNCHSGYITNEMIVDEQKSLINEVKFLRNRYRRSQKVIKDTREELFGVLRKLESAKRILDGVVIEDFDPTLDD